MMAFDPYQALEISSTVTQDEIKEAYRKLAKKYHPDLNPGNFNPAVADVDCDGEVDIIDALLIAQFYVDLITGFC